MAKKKSFTLKRNYLVNLYYGKTVAQYYFPNMTKREIVVLMGKRGMPGEGCDKITFVDVTGESGFFFLGALKIEAEVDE